MNIRGARGRLVGLVVAGALVAGLGLAGTATGAFAGDTGNAAVPVAAKPAAAVAAALAVPGVWTVTIDWSCDGTVASQTQTFNADGSWTSVAGSFTHSGRWFQVGSTIVWTFSDLANLVFSANVNSIWMSGVQGYNTSGGATGCFGAQLTSAAAAAAAAPAAKTDPVVAR